jgi:hypothetical protein
MPFGGVLALEGRQSVAGWVLAFQSHQITGAQAPPGTLQCSITKQKFAFMALRVVMWPFAFQGTDCGRICLQFSSLGAASRL